jgi:hypothetical protein
MLEGNIGGGSMVPLKYNLALYCQLFQAASDQEEEACGTVEERDVGVPHSTW